MSSENNRNAGGLGFVSALQLLFIGLKLGKVIDWPWWAVLMPTIVDLGIILVILAVYAAIHVWTNR